MSDCTNFKPVDLTATPSDGEPCYANPNIFVANPQNSKVGIITGDMCWSQQREPTISVTLDPGAICPTRGTLDSAGLDLYALEDTYIGHNSTLVPTGVHMAIPKGCVGIIKSRSSMAYKQNIYTEAGIIDCDFRQEIKVLLYHHKSEGSYPDKNGNFSNPVLVKERPMVKKGERIAQLLIVPVVMHNCEVVTQLDETARTGGFGSTGK